MFGEPFNLVLPLCDLPLCDLPLCDLEVKTSNGPI